MSGDGSEGARAGLEESLGMEDAEGGGAWGGGGAHAQLRPQFSHDKCSVRVLGVRSCTLLIVCIVQLTGTDCVYSSYN